MKKIISVLLVVAIVCVGLVACGNDADATSVDTTYISMRINPEIEMIADEDGEVVYVEAVNDDGEVVLSSVTLEGLSVEDAGAEFASAACELGYVDENDATVYLDIQGQSEEANNALREKVEKNISDYFNNNGINGKVSKETLEKYASNAKGWGLSTGHTKLAMRVLDAHPELTEDEVLSMEVSQWLTLLNGNKGNSSAAKELKAAYRQGLSQIKEKYARLFELREEMDTIEAQLKDEGLTEAERAEINGEIEELRSLAKELHNDYKSEISEARKSYKSELKELKAQEKQQSKKTADK